MKYKYKYKTVDVVIDFIDVYEYVEGYATDTEKLKLLELLVGKDNITKYNNTVADERKYKFLMDNFDKFSLEELEEKFNETYIP